MYDDRRFTHDTMKSVARSIALCMVLVLGACARTTGVIPSQAGGKTPAEIQSQSAAPADYDITIAGIGIRHVSNVTLSRKIDGAGATWISIRNKDGDWLYKAAAVTAIVRTSVGSKIGAATFIADLPLRTRAVALRETLAKHAVQSRTSSLVNRNSCLDPSSIFCDPACDASIQDCGPCPDCEGGIPYPSEDYGNCYGNLPCGVDGAGSGSGIISLFGSGLECDVNLSDGSADCYSTTEPPDLNAPANLFMSYRLTATHAILTCANPVHPGWAEGTYLDSVQGGVSRLKIIPVGPGTHKWDWPDDFKLGSTPAKGPTGPSVMKMTYFKFGIVNVIRGQAQGYCKSSG